jgi:predicted RNA-binding protein YlqC (UPF0109 family)
MSIFFVVTFSFFPRILSSMTTDQTSPLPGLEFVRTILLLLAEDKEQVVAEGTVDDLGILITVRVSDRDMGKLIGKSGQTIKSIRTLLRVIGGTAHQRVNLKVIEPVLAA